MILGISLYAYRSPRRIEEVHRLVALAFVPNPTALPAAIHVNGNPTDNRPINLKWCSFESQVFARSLRSKRRLPKLTAYGRSGGKGYDGADRSSSIDCEPVTGVTSTGRKKVHHPLQALQPPMVRQGSVYDRGHGVKLLPWLRHAKHLESLCSHKGSARSPGCLCRLNREKFW